MVPLPFLPALSWKKGVRGDWSKDGYGVLTMLHIGQPGRGANDIEFSSKELVRGKFFVKGGRQSVMEGTASHSGGF